MNPLWLIVLVLLVLAVQGRFFEKYVFRGLSLKRNFSSLSAFRGEELTLDMELFNRKLLPVTWLHVQQRFPMLIQFNNAAMVQSQNKAESIHNSDFYVLPFQKITRSYHIRCLERGYFELKAAELESTDLFGSKKYTEELPASAALSIYPRLVDVRDSLIPANSMQGDIMVRRWIMEDPLMIAGAREYTTTDDFRRINWKATAKHAKLKVNRYDYTADRKIMLLFNMDACGDIWKGFDPQIIESSIEVCASIAAELTKAGIPVGLATNAMCAGNSVLSSISPSAGEKQMMEILELLARIQYYTKYSFGELLAAVLSDISWGTELVIVAPYLDEAMLDSLRAVRDMKVTVIAVAPEGESSVREEIPANMSIFFYAGAGEKNEAV